MTLCDKCTATTSSSNVSVFVCVHQSCVEPSSLCRVNGGNAAGWRESPKLPPCTSASTKRRRSPVMSWTLCINRIFQVFMLETFGVPSVKSSKAPQKVFQKRGHQSHSQYLTINPIHRKNNIFSKPCLSCQGTQRPSCAVGFHMLRSSPSHGPGSSGPISEPKPHTRPSFSVISLPKNLKAPKGLQEIRWIFSESEEIWKLNLLYLTFSSFLLEKTGKKCWDLCSQLLFQLQTTSHQIWWFFFGIFASASDFCTASFNGR